MTLVEYIALLIRGFGFENYGLHEVNSEDLLADDSNHEWPEALAVRIIDAMTGPPHPDDLLVERTTDDNGERSVRVHHSASGLVGEYSEDDLPFPWLTHEALIDLKQKLDANL